MRNQYKILEEKYTLINEEGKMRMRIPFGAGDTYSRCERVLGIKDKDEIFDFINFIQEIHPAVRIDRFISDEAWDKATRTSIFTTPVGVRPGYYNVSSEELEKSYKRVLEALYSQYLAYKAAKANIDKGSKETGWDLSALDESAHMWGGDVRKLVSTWPDSDLFIDWFNKFIRKDTEMLISDIQEWWENEVTRGNVYMNFDTAKAEHMLKGFYRQFLKSPEYKQIKAIKANVNKGSEETGWDLSALDEENTDPMTGKYNYADINKLMKNRGWQAIEEFKQWLLRENDYEFEDFRDEEDTNDWLQYWFENAVENYADSSPKRSTKACIESAINRLEMYYNEFLDSDDYKYYLGKKQHIEPGSKQTGWDLSALDENENDFDYEWEDLVTSYPDSNIFIEWLYKHLVEEGSIDDLKWYIKPGFESIQIWYNSRIENASYYGKNIEEIINSEIKKLYNSSGYRNYKKVKANISKGSKDTGWDLSALDENTKRGEYDPGSINHEYRQAAAAIIEALPELKVTDSSKQNQLDEFYAWLDTYKREEYVKALSKWPSIVWNVKNQSVYSLFNRGAIELAKSIDDVIKTWYKEFKSWSAQQAIVKKGSQQTGWDLSALDEKSVSAPNDPKDPSNLYNIIKREFGDCDKVFYEWLGANAIRTYSDITAWHPEETFDQNLEGLWDDLFISNYVNVVEDGIDKEKAEKKCLETALKELRSWFDVFRKSKEYKNCKKIQPIIKKGSQQTGWDLSALDEAKGKSYGSTGMLEACKRYLGINGKELFDFIRYMITIATPKYNKTISSSSRPGWKQIKSLDGLYEYLTFIISDKLWDQGIQSGVNLKELSQKEAVNTLWKEYNDWKLIKPIIKKASKDTGWDLSALD